MLVTPGLSQLWVNFNGLMLCYCPETFNYKSNDINHVMVNTINTTAQLNHFSEIRTPQSGSVCTVHLQQYEYVGNIQTIRHSLS